MAQPFNVFSPRLAKLAAPGVDGTLGDVVFFRDVVDRHQPRFAQDFHNLTFRKFHTLHSYRQDCLGTWKNWITSARFYTVQTPEWFVKFHRRCGYGKRSPLMGVRWILMTRSFAFT